MAIFCVLSICDIPSVFVSFNSIYVDHCHLCAQRCIQINVSEYLLHLYNFFAFIFTRFYCESNFLVEFDEFIIFYYELS